MKKLLILYTTFSQKTTICTKQNYYSYTEQLLFGTLHFTRVLYTFFENYYYLFIKLLFCKQKRTVRSYTNKKVLLSRDSPCFFPAYLLCDETFFLQIANSVTRILLSQLFHCCIRFLAWVMCP